MTQLQNWRSEKICAAVFLASYHRFSTPSLRKAQGHPQIPEPAYLRHRHASTGPQRSLVYSIRCSFRSMEKLEKLEKHWKLLYTVRKPERWQNLYPIYAQVETEKFSTWVSTSQIEQKQRTRISSQGEINWIHFFFFFRDFEATITLASEKIVQKLFKRKSHDIKIILTIRIEELILCSHRSCNLRKFN